jgi:hypothetical protein
MPMNSGRNHDGGASKRGMMRLTAQNRKAKHAALTKIPAANAFHIGHIVAPNDPLASCAGGSPRAADATLLHS